MKPTFLEFEQPLVKIYERMEELRLIQDDSALDISEELNKLNKDSNSLLKKIYMYAILLTVN